MKVKKLKKLLENIPDNYEVVLSKDGEGNEFSPLVDVETGMYEADCTWSGELTHPDETNDYKENCVVLWPTN